MVLKDKHKEHDNIEFIANVLKFNNEINMLVIWKNEAELLRERIKEDFNKNYKHLGLNLICETENEILKGIHITLIESKLNLRKEYFVSTSGLFSIGDYEGYILLKINDLYEEMIMDYYTI